MKKYASGIKMTKASNPKEAQNNGNIIFEKLHNAFMINMNDLNKMINGLQEDFDKKEDKQGKGKWYLSST
ncbi:MAG: hypothetical protein BWY78_00278 [Alphaproteobacteria bacterium ADurb.Bin438]|nr:MAG: hypothetical protein BWY78_00278 [Alphaproteobacteria bacterium ADurb.Bin438]